MLDLVFLDCNMPTLTGGDTIRLILKNKHLVPNLPIIMTTSFPHDSVMQGSENVGISATVVENGQLALDILAKEKFDGVLMDLEMPVMDGYTATKKIR